MFVVQESEADHGTNKPVICPNCERGKLGVIPEWSEAVISRRGKPPPGGQNMGMQVKCHVCGRLWTIITE